MDQQQQQQRSFLPLVQPGRVTISEFGESHEMAILHDNGGNENVKDKNCLTGIDDSDTSEHKENKQTTNHSNFRYHTKCIIDVGNCIVHKEPREASSFSKNNDMRNEHFDNGSNQRKLSNNYCHQEDNKKDQWGRYGSFNMLTPTTFNSSAHDSPSLASPPRLFRIATDDCTSSHHSSVLTYSTCSQQLSNFNNGNRDDCADSTLSSISLSSLSIFSTTSQSVQSNNVEHWSTIDKKPISVSRHHDELISHRS
eukprot:9980603-Ditylum_brightwellii.AAC.1